MEHIDTVSLAKIRKLHTLGPAGTNCEAAAYVWFSKHDRQGKVILHDTLESAIEKMELDGQSALLGCVVYPDLYKIVFRNLHRLRLADVFLTPTYSMVMAAKSAISPRLVATHPAPRDLVPAGLEVALVTSNAQAAIDCFDGCVDACITTSVAAQKYGLTILRDFGPVNMGFTIHTAMQLPA